MTPRRLAFCCWALAAVCAAASSPVSASDPREPVNAISMARLDRLRPITAIASTRDGERHALRHAAQLHAAARRAAVRQVPSRLGRSQAATSRAARAGGVPGGSVWDRLAQCESGAHGLWRANTGNGYYGGLQFSARSWAWVGGTGLPHEHSREEQIRRAVILQRRQGWAAAWPACSRKLGLAP